MFENYSECYHCPGVHPMLSKVSPYDSAENDLAEGPFLGGFMKINKGRSLTMSGNACALTVDHPPSRGYGAASSGRFHLPGTMVCAFGRKIFGLEHVDLATGKTD